MKKKNRDGVPPSVSSGIIALVFLIIGYQTALFMGRSVVTGVLNKRDRPDTVYVVDSSLALALLSRTTAGEMPGHDSGRMAGGHFSVRQDSEHPRAVDVVRHSPSGRKTETFRFNPNTVSVEDLQRLGFSLKQAQSIDNYRLKGGRFRRKTDFASSYVVADSVYRRLEKYIDIPVLDLNLADSAELDDLPGIGAYFATKILEYRKELGGFSYKEQLMDLNHFDKEKFDALSDLVMVADRNKTAYPLWTAPLDSLRMHPYIKSYATARAIIIYRKNTPASQWTVDGLLKAGVLMPEQAEKLSRCCIRMP